MTKVLKRTSVSSNTKGASVSHEIYKVAFGAMVVLAIVIGVVSFAALGVGIAKALMIALA